jgi:hypothetical protein
MAIEMKSKEKDVQEYLCTYLNSTGQWNDECKKEVSVGVGRIDIITPRFIIEIKKYSQWKHAIGQVMVYEAQYFTRNGEHRDKYIYLFDVPDDLRGLSEITAICGRYGIGCLLHGSGIYGLHRNIVNQGWCVIV